MKYSNTFLMFVIFVSIVVLLFLNLVLGSVSIPFHSVWNIIWRQWRRTGHLAEYYLEITLSASLNGISRPEPD